MNSYRNYFLLLEYINYLYSMQHEMQYFVHELPLKYRFIRVKSPFLFQTKSVHFGLPPSPLAYVLYARE